MVERLSTLFELQLIDNHLDELEELRGDLPAAVNELKYQIKSLEQQVEAKEEEKNNSLEKRKQNDEDVERLSNNLKRFKAQLYQVRNNKEYDALTKEIDHAEEQIGKFEAETKALEELSQKLKIEIKDVEPQLEKFNEELKEKEAELKQIIKANEREEARLKDKREKVASKVKKPDYNTYMRIRKALGGKAVAFISRAACSGCHNVVPPQRQIEIKSNKRIFSCESCGRILIGQEVAEEVETKAQL
ncbi:MAG: zinc ribbon domain protein [Ignavibacteria bacterium]|nr:MAG: zinc ribbon domain protein [Ignavibacteria bacterium]KAF0156416.1 MAG: zinc ribbon domain protein [Ignavibacteria bacterium]